MKKINTKSKAFRITMIVLAAVAIIVACGIAFAIYLAMSFFRVAGPGDGYKPLSEAEFRSLDSTKILQESVRAQNSIRIIKGELEHKLVGNKTEAIFASQADGCYPEESMAGFGVSEKLKVCEYKIVMIFGTNMTKQAFTKVFKDIGWESYDSSASNTDGARVYRSDIEPLPATTKAFQGSVPHQTLSGSVPLPKDEFTLYTKKELFDEKKAYQAIKAGDYEYVARVVLSQNYYYKSIWHI